jgi:serine/threonine protein kinase
MNSDVFQAPTFEELAPLFPNYEINAFIAQGGMGAVYLATQTTLDRQVAIKILPRHLGADPEFRESFQAEAKAMAKLNHPNLIGVFDFGEVDAMPFIAMEYVAGSSLHESSYGQQIDPEEAGRIVVATLRGLHHAHENGILHRDVKPANILLDPQAHPKLGDFGLAMSNNDESDGLAYGTPGYAAPEVYEGHPDHRSDNYAAAAMFYQLLTGELPANPYQRPSQLCDCDPRFDVLFNKALQPDPDDRHHDAQDLADAIDTILTTPRSQFATSATTSRPIAAPIRRATQKQLASAKSSGGGGLLVVILLLAAIGGAAFFFMNSDSEEPESPTNTVPIDPASYARIPEETEETNPSEDAPNLEESTEDTEEEVDESTPDFEESPAPDTPPES